MVAKRVSKNTTNTNVMDEQVGGGHYKIMRIQPIEFIYINDIPYMEGNVIKYVVRHRYKNGLEDLLKAKDYIDKLIALHYSNDAQEALINRIKGEVL